MSARRFDLLAILLGSAGFVLAICLESFTSIDVRLQDRFFDFRRGAWLVDAQAPGPRALFYNGPKLVLLGVGVGLFILGLKRKSPWHAYVSRRAAFYLVGCLSVIPLVVSGGKNVLRAHCPSELKRYGGPEAYHPVISAEEKVYREIRPHCFPAGHASGGFALLGLFFVRRRALMLVPGLVVGWTMAGYQMLKGAHFLSHSLATMFLAIALAGILHRIFKFQADPKV